MENQIEEVETRFKAK
jgi:hypothetical protein